MGQAAPGADGGLVTVDLDATIVTACPEKEQAAATWKKTYGFHPLAAFADHRTPERTGSRSFRPPTQDHERLMLTAGHHTRSLRKMTDR